MWRGNYVIDSSQPSPWLHHCAFLDFMAKTSENRSNWLKNNQNEQKNPNEKQRRYTSSQKVKKNAKFDKQGQQNFLA